MKIERIDNVIKVRFDQECRLTAPRIFQYDRGQRIEFLDIPDGVEVQFSNDDTDKTSNKIITDSQVEIPDFLIAMNGTITAYLQYIDENSQTTKKFLVIPVQERKQPEEYISEDDKPGFRADMQKIMNDTKEIAESAKKEAQSVREDADAGLFNGKDYILTEDDKSEIAENVAENIPYVPNDRCVAELPLSSDITIAELVNKLTNDVNHYLQNYISTQVVENSIVKGKADKTYVDELIDSLTLLDVKKVDILPTTDISTSTIYLVLREHPQAQNVYDEYMYIGSDWEHIGTTDIELSDYVQKTRKIAGMDLSSDISPEELLAVLTSLNEFKTTLADKWLTMYDDSFENTIKNTITNHEDVSANTSLRHSHENKDILDRISESANGWELILDKTLPGANNTGVMLDFSDLTLSGEYEELYMSVACMGNTDVGNVDVYVNNGTAPELSLRNFISSGVTNINEFKLSDEERILNRYIKIEGYKTEAGSNATRSTAAFYKAFGGTTVQSVRKIKNLKLIYGTGWSNSSERHLLVYGKRVKDINIMLNEIAKEDI